MQNSLFSNLVSQVVAIVVVANLAFAAPPASAPVSDAEPQPTGLIGESWLVHLGRSFDETSMGKTGRLGPPETAGDDLMRQLTSSPRQFVNDNKTLILHGSDLYRMNCRGCHGENGVGAPPEINSVINPVRATSAALVRERLKAAGADMSWADAVKLAQQSRAMLLDRLHHGGHDMPAFPHLSDAEVNALIAYLRQLTGVPGAENEQLTMREQRLRVGEQIAKSTCHICHSAEGPNPSAVELYQGAIPPLSTLPLRVNRNEFVRKVTQGAPVLMGGPPQLLRGRMPVFYYLSEEEAADVYLYLTTYPPRSSATPEEAAASAEPSGGPEPSEISSQQVSMPQPAAAQFGHAVATDSVQTQTMLADEQVMVLAFLLGLLASMVLCLGFCFTVRELRRLSGEHRSKPREETRCVPHAIGLGPELAQ